MIHMLYDRLVFLWKYDKNLKLIYCFVCELTCCGPYMEIRGQLRELVLFPPCGPMDQTQIIRHGSKHLYQLAGLPLQPQIKRVCLIFFFCITVWHALLRNTENYGAKGEKHKNRKLRYTMAEEMNII